MARLEGDADDATRPLGAAGTVVAVATLDGADFGKYQMKFPARVKLRTTTGEEYVAEVDAPVGAPGRPLDETDRAVRRKFRRAATGVLADPEGALEAVLHIDDSTDVRDLVTLLTSR